MSLVNPLHYPLAVFLGVLVWVVGVRVGSLPRLLVVPVGVGVALGASGFLHQRELQARLDPALARQISDLRQQVHRLVEGAEQVRAEAARLLADAPDFDLLITVQEVCDQVQTLPQAVEQQLARLRQMDEAVLSVETLERQLAQVQRQQRHVGPAASEQFAQLAASLARNIQLAKAGQDIRSAHLTALATLVQDAAGVLQQLQNQLRAMEVGNPRQRQEVQALSETLRGFEQQMTILTRR
ncbi:MAG: hypothetical protein RMI89_06630 [Gloeomargarita sp. SKYBB_i_bin120]|nr:hypothetical protein [Gloeomargarita sp. SKYG98]MCS7292635.1 hypothetical protein [Gloeomargarita sp. SKYB120]MDW8178197.1 hypothetical protein [Gloeomargarita sp. SKYBB_i_bin120]